MEAIETFRDMKMYKTSWFRRRKGWILASWEMRLEVGWKKDIKSNLLKSNRQYGSNLSQWGTWLTLHFQRNYADSVGTNKVGPSSLSG